MRRVAVGLGLVAEAWFLASGEGMACGDKLLVLGQRVRSQRAHGAARRGSVLVFLDPGGQLQGALQEMRLRRDLELAGHRLREVSTPGELEMQIRSGTHDILLADISAVEAIEAELAVPGSPTLLPVVVNASGDEWAEAEAKFACIRGAPSAGKHYLAVIEDALAQRRAATRK